MKQKRTRWGVVLLAVAVVMSLLTISAAATDEPWDGTSENTKWYNENKNSFTLTSAADLAGLAELVNAGNTFSGKTIELGADIDLGGKEWTPIGTAGKPFQGTFDGAKSDTENYTISNLSITKGFSNTVANNNIGLFGYTNAPAVIKNVDFYNVDIQGSLYVGTVVGYGFTGSQISNCHVSGKIEIDGWWYIGGIGGNGYVSNVANCTVIGSEGSYIKANMQGSYVGGIWGYRGEGNNVISNCTVENMNISGEDRVGGICGIAHYQNAIKKCSIQDSVITSANNIGNTGLIAGADLSNETNGVAQILDCTVTGTTATSEGVAVTTQVGSSNHQGIVAAKPATVGAGVQFDNSGKIIAGTLEQVAPDQLAEDKTLVQNSDGTYSVEALTSENAVAVVGTTLFKSLSEAISAANAVEGTAAVTVTIKQSGSYDPFTITRANVTVQAAENVDAEIEVSSTKTGNINAANVTLKGLNYVSTDGTTIFSAGNCDGLKLDGCTFTGTSNGSGTGTALYIHQPNITITGCTFTNFERGYYTCGDNHAAGEMTFTNNTFNNVRVPIDGYWGKTATTETDIQITGNTIDVGSWGTSYIQLWDYAQYLKWLEGDALETDHQGSAIDATIKNNTYYGDVVIYATHFDWFSESDLELDDASEALLKYRVLVELEGAASATVRNADGSEITAFNESTTSSTRGSKTVIYSICVGDYLFDIKPTDSEAVLHKNATIKKSETGDTNKVTVSADESAVAKVGDKTYTSFAAAIEAAKDGGTVELLSDVTVDVWNQAWNAKNLTIKGNGFTWTVGKVESNVNGNYLFYGAENLQVKDLTVIFQTNGNGFDMVSGSLDNVTMYGGANSNYAVFVGSSDEDAKVSIEKCVFENFKGAAVYSQPAGTDKRTSDITVNKATISNCGMTMCSYAQNTVFTNNSVTGGSEISFAGAAESADRDNTYLVTGNTFQNAGTLWFHGADLGDVTFAKNKVLGTTCVSTDEAQTGKLDVSENYWGGDAPSAEQCVGNAIVGKDVYYQSADMDEGDLNTDRAVILVYNNGEQDRTDYVTAGEAYTLPSKPTKKGYTFLGWKSSADREVYKAGDRVRIYEDTTFTAQWMSNWEIVDDIAGAAGAGKEFFTDVKAGDWYYDAVKFVFDNNFMDGVGDNKFNPDGTLTRAMIAQVLYNLEGETGSYPTVFDDVAKSAWYADAVNWAAASGIVEGKGNNKFDPNAAITRQEMAAILYRYSDLKGYDVSDVDSLSSFNDASQVASWAKEAMGWAVENYVINGKGAGKLDPTGTATRAEVAQILMNLCNNVL